MNAPTLQRDSAFDCLTRYTPIRQLLIVHRSTGKSPEPPGFDERPLEGSSTRTLLIEIAAVALFWTVMAFLFVGQRAVGQRGPFPSGVTRPDVLQAFVYFYFWALLTPFIFRLAGHYRIDRTDWPQRLAIHFAIGMLVSMCTDLYGDYTRFALGVGRRWQNRPFSVREAFLDLWWLNELIIYVAVLSGGFARSYFLRYQDRLRESAELQAQTTRLRAQLAEARLQSLRMQLNPHFLFNTLHAISSLVDRDPRGVRRMIARLSDLLRHSLDGSEEQEIPLQAEVRQLDRYLDIEQVRFQGRLTVEEDIAADVADALLPTFILQPLVENAIKHGVSRREGVGEILISAWREADDLIVTVTDNGPGLGEDAAPAPGVGLRNTRERLEALYGNRYDLTIDNAEDGDGCVARISLPFHREPVAADTAVSRNP